MEAGGSRQKMIEATVELMRAAGLGGAGINEIVRASGAPKGSVYHFFPGGKQQIAAEALEWYSPRVMDFVETALGSGASAAQRVEALFDAFARRVADGNFHRSCAVGAVCLDLDAELDGLRGVAAGAFDQWVRLIATHFPGDRRAARSFAGLILTAIEGAYIRARAERSSRAFTEAGAWLAELAAQRFDKAPARARRRR